MDDNENMFAAAAERIFTDMADLQAAADAPYGGWRDALWQTLLQNGLTLAMVPEDQGGVGLDAVQAFELLRVAGRWAVPTTLADTMIANWALALTGCDPNAEDQIAIVDPLRSTIQIDEGGLINGWAEGVADASTATQIIAIAEHQGSPHLILIDPETCQIDSGKSLSFEAADRVALTRAATMQIEPLGKAANLLEMAAVARASQIAGALEAILAMSVDYAKQRVAFGRPISKFQAIQHHLALLGEETAAAVSAACSAADALATGTTGPELLLEVASAKVRCGEAAERGCAIAHQVFGAIGYTAEHPLHRLTLSALAWRDDFGNESHWALKLGDQIMQQPADALWPLLSSR